MKTALAEPESVIFEFETDEGLIRIDSSQELGELTPAEFKLFMRYVNECGLEQIHAEAGAAILILLSREISMPHEELLERVI